MLYRRASQNMTDMEKAWFRIFFVSLHLNPEKSNNEPVSSLLFPETTTRETHGQKKRKTECQVLTEEFTFFPGGHLFALLVKTVMLAGDQRRKPDHSD